MLCPCGQPTHPNYGNRCEDCWADGQGARHMESRPAYLSDSRAEQLKQFQSEFTHVDPITRTTYRTQQTNRN